MAIGLRCWLLLLLLLLTVGGNHNAVGYGECCVEPGMRSAEVEVEVEDKELGINGRMKELILEWGCINLMWKACCPLHVAHHLFVRAWVVAWKILKKY